MDLSGAVPWPREAIPPSPGTAARTWRPALPFELVFVGVTSLFFAFVAFAVGGLVLGTNPVAMLRQLARPEIRFALQLSLLTSFAVVLASVAVGLPVAFVLARMRFFGKAFFDTLLDIPIVLPPLVSGLALLHIMGADSALGTLLRAWHIDVIFTPLGIVVAQFFVSAPFFIRAARESMAVIPRSAVEAASIFGASPWHVFTHVILPMSRNGIVAGVLMAWARALGEFGATAMVASCVPFRTETITTAIYMETMSGDPSAATTLAVLLLLFSCCLLVGVRRLARRNNECGCG